MLNHAYGDKCVIVVTSRLTDVPKEPLEIRSDVDALLIHEPRRLDDGDVWMLGGGQLQMAFLKRGALDEIEIYVIPEMLGGGRPLFPPTGLRTSPTLISARQSTRVASDTTTGSSGGRRRVDRRELSLLCGPGLALGRRL